MAAFDPATLDRWRTLAVVDRDGTTVGTISEFYLDRETGHPTWALVNTGLFGVTKTFVPLVHATEISDGLQVPYEKSHIKDAPQVDLHDELSPDEEAALFSHYGVDYQPSTEPTPPEPGLADPTDPEAAGSTLTQPTLDPGRGGPIGDDPDLSRPAPVEPGLPGSIPASGATPATIDPQMAGTPPKADDTGSPPQVDQAGSSPPVGEAGSSVRPVDEAGPPPPVDETGSPPVRVDEAGSPSPPVGEASSPPRQVDDTGPLPPVDETGSPRRQVDQADSPPGTEADQSPSGSREQATGPSLAAAGPGPVPATDDEAVWTAGAQPQPPAEPVATDREGRWADRLDDERPGAPLDQEERSPLERARRRLERLVSGGQAPNDPSPSTRDAPERARRQRFGLNDPDDPNDR